MFNSSGGSMEAPNCFPMWLRHFTLLPIVYKSSSFPQFSPTLGMAGLFNSSRPDVCGGGTLLWFACAFP